MKFTDLTLADEVISGLNDIRFIEPTPIQEQTIPHVLSGKDMIGVAQTGTGKTGAFVIPLLQRIFESDREGIKTIILTPTRELAQQIDEQIFAIGYHTGITSATVIGGSDFSTQAKALKAGVDIIVATPGRFMDQNKVVNIDLSTVEFLVLDEADRMLDMGFLPDMKKIIDWLPTKRQTLLFSATMPKEIERLASTIMNNPEKVEIARSKPPESVEQRAYFLRSNQKIPLVKQIFDTIQWDSCIIFTSTKKGTDELQRLLKKSGIKAGSIHGDRSQDERNKALNAFKNGESPVIVATNVIARGIDIKDVSMIINYDVPRSTDDYVHRIGRTGRYDKSGIAVTLVTKRDRKSFADIDKIKDNKLRKIELPESFGPKSSFSWDTYTFEDNRTSSKESGSGSTGRTDRKKRSEETPAKKDSNNSGRTKKSTSGDRGKGSKRGDSQKKNGSDTSAKETTSREPRQTQSSNGKESSKKAGRRPSDQSSGQKDSGENKPETRRIRRNIPRIEKATERNRNAPQPSKGIWGLIKSFLPLSRRN
ncbi:MAG: DEAD/DEAH box helicase [Balneolaceae bacterium]